jgi:hypothetical protein
LGTNVSEAFAHAIIENNYFFMVVWLQKQKPRMQGAAGKYDFCHFFGAPTSKNNEKSILQIIDFCLSSTFLRDFYRVRKIDRTFD